jgi:hypothetical protein
MLILGSDEPVNLLNGGGSTKYIFGYGHGKYIPLFEELVKAFSRDPDKIKRISDTIDDLKKAGDAKDILPEGFNEIWEAFRNIN